jgi:hypothetical protein
LERREILRGIIPFVNAGLLYIELVVVQLPECEGGRRGSGFFL